MDCNYRTNQSGDHKFTSALRAGETWAQDLYNYLKQFNIGIAGTLPNASFTAHHTLTYPEQEEKKVKMMYM